LIQTDESGLRPARTLAPMPRLARLRSKLLLLVAGSLLPVLVLAVVFGAALVEHERENFRRSTQDRHRTLLSAIDEQLKGHLSTLEALAVSSALQSGDLKAFDAVARRVLPTQEGWQNIMVLDASGQHLVNLRVPFGTPMPRALDSEMPFIERALDGGRPVIGNLARGGVTRNWGIAIRMRVQPSGRDPLLLQFVLDPRSLQPLMRAQGYPQSWAYGLADANGRFMVRVPDAAPGTDVSPDFTRARAEADQGWYRGRTLEGKDTWTAFRTSAMTGWTVGVAIPHGEVVASALRVAAWLAGGALLSLLLALAFAAWLGQRIARPIAELALHARQLGRRAVAPQLERVKTRASVTEVHAVATALQDADAALQDRESLRQREQEALRAADKAKDEFLAMLGHELRNPLSAITASAHVLRLSKPEASAATKAHEVIERQARQMTRLVEDLMDVSRLAMGKVTLQLEPLDLAVLADRVAITWQDAGRSRAGRVRTDLRPAWVEGDRTRLEQVLTNLLDNAHKFSGGEGRIDLRVRTEGRGGRAPGAGPRRGHPPGRPAVDLRAVRAGAAVVRPAAGRHRAGADAGAPAGGTAARQRRRGQRWSRAGRLLHGPAAADRGAVGRRAGGAGTAATGMARRVLLVEDNDDGRQTMEMVLVLEGHTVRAVGNGLEAVQCAAEWQPDVALVDIGLPDIDGYEVARRIRALALENPPKLVAITGFGQPQDQRTAYEAGFDLHLTKPVAPQFLRDVLHALTSRQGAGEAR
jgi:signal transduction histidine kinase/ActR/RegA family two-component response regulator